MNRNSKLKIKRLAILSLAVGIIMTTTNMKVLAKETDASEQSDSNMLESEYVMNVAYDIETGKITYGEEESESCESGAVEDMASTCGVINGESRHIVDDTTASPYRNICFLESTFPDGTKMRGSGTLVYFDVVLTAAHVIYSHDHGGWATSVEVVPGMKNYTTRPLGATIATQLNSNTEWTQNKNYEWDWAMVDLKSSFSTWQLFGYYKDYSKQNGTTVTTIGYPTSLGTNMYYDTSTVSEAGDRYLKVLCDIESGDSGGAVIDVNSGVLVGIISYEHKNWLGKYDYNGVVRINEDLYNRIAAHRNY